MSVQVFQALIPLSAKYKYNMAYSKAEHFGLCMGEPGKDLQRRCHLRSWKIRRNLSAGQGEKETIRVRRRICGVWGMDRMRLWGQ